MKPWAAEDNPAVTRQPTPENEAWSKDRDIAEPRTILRGLVGSTVHGLALDGTDDRDEMGVCIEPPERVIGLKPFEQWVYRTQPEGHPSGFGDLDLTIYSLRKYVRLALGGNPSVLLLLFVPPESLSITTELGRDLQSKAPLIISRQAGRHYLGYLKAQRERLIGIRGGRAPRKDDPYDTKYAMHMVRLGYQGRELMTTGTLSLPMPDREREIVMGIRRGQWTLEDLVSLTEGLEDTLVGLLDTSPLREFPARDAVDQWMVRTYLERWGC